jgi:hypothetical protein
MPDWESHCKRLSLEVTYFLDIWGWCLVKSKPNAVDRLAEVDNILVSFHVCSDVLISGVP